MKQHDKIIYQLADELKDCGYKAVINPTQEKNGSIDGLYPDIIVTDTDMNPVYIIEVETIDSINNTEAKQWKNYTKTQIPFILCVPKESLYKTMHICQQYNIDVHCFLNY